MLEPLGSRAAVPEGCSGVLNWEHWEAWVLGQCCASACWGPWVPSCPTPLCCWARRDQHQGTPHCFPQNASFGMPRGDISGGHPPTPQAAWETKILHLVWLAQEYGGAGRCWAAVSPPGPARWGPRCPREPGPAVPIAMALGTPRPAQPEGTGVGPTAWGGTAGMGPVGRRLPDAEGRRKWGTVPGDSCPARGWGARTGSVPSVLVCPP